MSIRVLLIEDHFLARMALRSVLNGRGDISLVAEASDGASGVEMYRQCAPDVTVMDLRLPGLSGFDAITAIRKLCKTAKIAVLSNYEGSEDIYRAIRNGAMAYLNKNASGEELVEAIVTVHKGLRYLPADRAGPPGGTDFSGGADSPRARSTYLYYARAEQP